MTMQVIQHIELGSAQASITFSSIPNTFTDLLLLVSARSTNTAGGAGVVTQLNMQFNGSAATNYTDRTLAGDGSTAFSFARASQSVIRISGVPTGLATANTFGNVEIYIPNYASSNPKSVSLTGATENNATTAEQSIVAGLWNQTAAITQISLVSQDGTNFAGGSSATLYGITKGSDGTTTVS